MVALDALGAEKPVHLAVGLVPVVVLIAQAIVIVDVQVAIVVLLSVKEDVALGVLAVLVDVLGVVDAAEVADLLVDMDVLLIVAADAELFARPVLEHAKDARDVVVAVADVLGVLMRVQVVALVDALEIATEIALADVDEPVQEHAILLVRILVLDAQAVVRVIVQKVALDVLDVEVLAPLVVLAVQDVAEDVADALVLVLILVKQLVHQLVLIHAQARAMVQLL